MSFPKTLLFGAASSAYQVEGGWNDDGKGESIWDNLTHNRPEMIIGRGNGDVACDSYHLWEKDVSLLKHIGFDVYRFSISWTRILPSGFGDIDSVNEAGVKYYSNLIDELLKNGIQPFVTIYHWDLPQGIQELGGWTNPKIIDYIENFADILFQLFGDRVKWWGTINEPWQITQGYSWRDYAPALQWNSPADYKVIHNVILAHGRIYRLYEKKYKSKQNGKLGLSLASHFFQPQSESIEDAEAARRAFEFYIGIYANPIYSKEGDYPKIVRKIVDQNSANEGRPESRLPEFTEEEKKSLIGSFDYLGLNHYTTQLVKPGTGSEKQTFMNDMNVKLSVSKQWPPSEAPWLYVVPWGFKELLKSIKNKYDNPPIFVTENGYADEYGVDDVRRVDYYQQYLSKMLEAINEDGCNVIGYTAWSLLDSLEWLSGYSFGFGLVAVDFKGKERERTLKSSAKFFKKFLKHRTLL